MDNLGNIKLSAENTKPIVCEECGNDVFVQGCYIRRVPGLLIGSQEDGMIPMNTFICSKCGHINKEFQVNVDNEEEKKKSSLIL